MAFLTSVAAIPVVSVAQTAAPKTVPVLAIPGSSAAEKAAETDSEKALAEAPAAAKVSAAPAPAANAAPAVNPTSAESKAPAAPEVAGDAESEELIAEDAVPGKKIAGKKSAGAEKKSGKPAQEKYQKAQEAYKKAVLAVRDLQKQYVALSTTDEEKEEIGEKLQQYSEFITKLYPKLMDLAENAWLETPSKDPETLRFIVEVLEVRLVTEDYERAQGILKGLLDQNIPEILPDLYDVAGETAFMLNQFEQANRFFAEAEAKNVLSDRCKAFKNDLQYYRTAWAKESILRQKETESGKLPRVKLETTKGPIVLELYENEAPNTVANFVYLVEKGFYDGLYFDPVIAGFCAESGRSMETEDGGPGYSIRDEFDEMNPRTHFRGTISMAKGEPNTAGSRFFLNFSPMRQLDGKFVVFGRIVEGMDVLSKLQRMDPASPDPMAEADQITEAKVLRKQDHKYRPKILKKASPDDEENDASAKKAKKGAKSKKAKSGSAY